MTKDGSWRAYALVGPALAVIAVFFVLPLAMSAVLAFRGKAGEFTLELLQRGAENEITPVDRLNDRGGDLFMQISVLQREVQERDPMLLPHR